MSNKERREREKAALRAAILQSAQQLAIEEGWSAVSIRKIAERIEYSPPMVYEYFDDKEALLRAIKGEAFGRLLGKMQREREKATDATEALYAIGRAYLEFAFANPAIYRMMHGLDGVPFDSNARNHKPPEVLAVIGLVMELLQGWAGEQSVQFTSVENAFFMMWSGLHGLIALHFSGAIPFDVPHIHTLARGQIEAYMITWRITPP
jgi:AcrR family transcriptional regulator